MPTLAARALQEASGHQNGAFGDRFWNVFGLLFLPFAASLVWPSFASLGGRLWAFSFARRSCSRASLVNGANAPYTVKHKGFLKFRVLRLRPRAPKKDPTTNRRRVRKQTAPSPKNMENHQTSLLQTSSAEVPSNTPPESLFGTLREARGDPPEG